LDQFVRGQAEVFSKTRVQNIQTVDGGVLDNLYVKEGDFVNKGQIIAKINAERFQASSNEIKARVGALKAKIARLTAELNETELKFSESLEKSYPEIVLIERTLFNSRLQSLSHDIKALNDTLTLAEKEQEIVDLLKQSGDVDEMEVLNAQKTVIDARSKLNSRLNEYREQATSDLVKARDELSQSNEVLIQRENMVESSDVIANVSGYVKNINVSTIGAVLKPGEQLLEIIPNNDELLIEAKISPKDIADLSIGQIAKIRLDSFDSSIYGSVDAKVSFISGDTVNEETNKGGAQNETFYIVYLTLNASPIKTSVGKQIILIPGMTGQVDIKTGNRSVMTYLLKPIIKTFDKSFGER
jgi:adhesin transport system membrane fusion protein